MDFSSGSTPTAASGSRKRPRFPGWGYERTEFEFISAAVDQPPTDTPHNSKSWSKRVRLSGCPRPVVSSLERTDLPRPSCIVLTDLSPEILQHVFTFLDPITLARLICVNRSIRSLLDPACSLPQRSASGQIKHLSIRTQDSIWAISRRAYLHGFPKPMDTMTELEMWRLALSHSCQFCGKKTAARLASSSSDPWTSGPGVDNVRPVWPFRVRSCGRCLRPRLIKVRFLYRFRSPSTG